MCCAGVLIFAAFLFRRCLLVLYKYVLIAAVFANVVVKTVFELQQITTLVALCVVNKFGYLQKLAAGQSLTFYSPPA